MVASHHHHSFSMFDLMASTGLWGTELQPWSTELLEDQIILLAYGGHLHHGPTNFQKPNPLTLDLRNGVCKQCWNAGKYSTQRFRVCVSLVWRAAASISCQCHHNSPLISFIPLSPLPRWELAPYSSRRAVFLKFWPFPPRDYWQSSCLLTNDSINVLINCIKVQRFCTNNCCPFWHLSVDDFVWCRLHSNRCFGGQIRPKG